MNSSLCSILQRAGVLSESQENELVQWTSSGELTVPEGIVDKGWLSASNLATTISELFGLETRVLSETDYINACKRLGLREIILEHNALPVAIVNNTLSVATADPSLMQTENDFRFATGMQVELVIANCEDIRAAIRKLYGDNNLDSKSNTKQLTSDDLANLVQVSDAEIDNIEDLSQDDSPVSRFIHQVLMDAVRKKASDIHFEPYEHLYRIRLRCDGILIETHQPATQLSRRLAARIKILAKLDIAERRLPQDGRLKLRLSESASIDMRVSTCQPCGVRRSCCDYSMATLPISISISWVITHCKNLSTLPH